MDPTDIDGFGRQREAYCGNSRSRRKKGQQSPLIKHLPWVDRISLAKSATSQILSSNPKSGSIASSAHRQLLMMRLDASSRGYTVLMRPLWKRMWHLFFLPPRPVC